MNFISVKNVLLILCLSILLTVWAAAQSDFEDPKWTKLSNPTEEFSLNFPSVRITGVPRSSIRKDSGKYFSSLNKAFFAAFSDDQASPSVYDDLKSFTEASGSTSFKDVEIDGLKGRRYDFHGSDDFFHSYIVIQAPVHFYIFHVMSEASDNALTDDFFASIHFDNKLPEIYNAEPVTPPSAPVESAAPGNFKDILKKPVSSSNGITYSRENPSVFDAGAPPKYSRIDTDVTILSKPQAPYTDLARKYMISGTVRLRLTFEKDKQISDVTVLSKLPLGLTQSAIRAARQIKFAPALRQGEPYTSTKAVEYNFNVN